jgi:hypothetical protein
MLKFLTTGNITYKGQLFRGRKIIGTEETLALIYPLRNKAIFTSGWRSKAEQAEMVKKGASKTMDSNHLRGCAYDIWNWSEMEKEMRKLGFKNEISWDKGHFPLGGEDSARKNYKIISSLPKVLEEYKPKTVKNAPISSTEVSNDLIQIKIAPSVSEVAKTIPQEIQTIKLSDLPKIGEIISQEVKPTIQDKVSYYLEEFLILIKNIWKK